MATLGGTTLPNLQSEAWRKLSTLVILPFPLQDSDETDVFDFGGVTEEITLVGKVTAVIATVRTFITTISGYIDGDQSAPVVFASDLRNASYNVKVDSFDYDWEFGQGDTGTIILNYTIKVVRSSTR